MTGLRKRVTVGFLSIVCLLFFSGMVSLLELGHLSRDTGEILKANARNIELAKEMLDAGASLIEIYTGFIYEGPGFVKRILKYLQKTVKN